MMHASFKRITPQSKPQTSQCVQMAAGITLNCATVRFFQMRKFVSLIGLQRVLRKADMTCRSTEQDSDIKIYFRHICI